MVAVFVPDDAPLWLNPQDGGVLHVLKLQLLMYFGFVHPHGHLHLIKAVVRGCGVTDNVLRGPPVSGMKQKSTSLKQCEHDNVTIKGLCHQPCCPVPIPCFVTNPSLTWGTPCCGLCGNRITHVPE